MQTPSISEIEPGLFLGNAKSSWHIATLENNGITARVSLGIVRFAAWTGDNVQKIVPLDRTLFIACLDSSTQDLLVHLSEACGFIDQMCLPRKLQTLESHDESAASTLNAVLVHCDQGISRSTTVIVAYLMRKYELKLDEALEAVKAKRKVRPNANFMSQLQVWEEVRYQIWEDTEKQVPKGPYAAYLEKRASA